MIKLVTRLAGNSRLRWPSFLFLLLAALLIIASGLYFRPLPKIQPTLDEVKAPAAASLNLPWPTYGQASVTETTFGSLYSSLGVVTPEPMASTAKVITTLAVLKQKPLNVGETGPLITFGPDDVAIYNDYVAKGGSVVKVTDGEQLSEYQALQAMLIPSANNMADSLAKWAFGSLDAYTAYASQLLASMHLADTKVVDASGFNNASVSTAQDLVKLGEALMQNPVAAGIVNQTSADLPIAGKVQNVNWLLGNEGVNGIKTGNTDEAGGCFLWSAKRQVLGQEMNFIGAVMGAPSLQQAINDSAAIINALDQNFANVTVVKKGQIVGHYTAPWGASTNIVAKDDFTFIAWKGWNLDVSKNANPIAANTDAGASVGSLRVWLGRHAASQTLVTDSRLSQPPWTWRFFR